METQTTQPKTEGKTSTAFANECYNKMKKVLERSDLTKNETNIASKYLALFGEASVQVFRETRL